MYQNEFSLMARTIRRIKVWLPSAMLVLFALFAIPSVLVKVHGQDPTSNAEKIGVLEGRVDGIKRETETMPEQLSAMRDRLVRVEIKADRIESFTSWAIGVLTALLVGVFGNLAATWATHRARQAAVTESGNVPLYRGKKGLL